MMKDQLLQELNDDSKKSFSAGRCNNIYDIILSCSVALLSVIAAGLVAADFESSKKWIVVVVAAMPAAITTLQSRLRPAELSAWYFQRSTMLESLALELRYAETPELKEFVQRYSAALDDLERRWRELKQRPVSDRPQGGKSDIKTNDSTGTVPK